MTKRLFVSILERYFVVNEPSKVDKLYNELFGEQSGEKENKSAEDLLFETMTENNFTYVSFPAFVENESSVDVFDITCKAIEKYQSNQSEQPVKDEEIQSKMDRAYDQGYQDGLCIDKSEL